MAEGIMRSKVEAQKLPYTIDSAGTSNYHVDEAPDERAIAEMKKNKIDIRSLRGRQFQQEDFDTFDLILAMDTSNYSNILRLARHDNDRDKVKLILSYLKASSEESVPDPYYGGQDGFKHVFNLLNEACDEVIQSLQV